MVVWGFVVLGDMGEGHLFVGDEGQVCWLFMASDNEGFKIPLLFVAVT